MTDVAASINELIEIEPNLEFRSNEFVGVFKNSDFYKYMIKLKEVEIEETFWCKE